MLQAILLSSSTGDSSVCDAVLHNAVFLGSRLSNRLDTQNRPLCHLMSAEKSQHSPMSSYTINVF